MFADLEQTLCEGLSSLTFGRTEDNHADINIDCLEDVTDLSKVHGPAVRC